MDTAARPDSPEQAFHANDFEEAPEYSSVSALAIVGLLFGFASPLCLVSRFFLIIPVVGAVLSIFALARIASSGGALAGRLAAVVGLAMCILFGVAEMSRGAITRYLRTSEAQKFAHDWLVTLASGKVDEALHMTVDGQRPPSLAAPGEPKPTTTPLEEFQNSDLIKNIEAAGKDAKIDFQGTEDYQRLSWRQFIVRQRFRITPAGTTGEATPNELDVDVTTQRSHFLRETHSRWLVSKFDNPTDGTP